MLFHCKPVNQQKSSIFALILWEEQTKPFLKRKKVPKLYFYFWPPKMSSLLLFNTYLVMWKYNCEPLWLIAMQWFLERVENINIKHYIKHLSPWQWYGYYFDSANVLANFICRSLSMFKYYRYIINSLIITKYISSIWVQFS